MSPPRPYDDILMDHIKNARNYRVLAEATCQASGANPLCGDELTIYVKLAEGHLQQVGFQCTCCGISMASASIMTEAIDGKDMADVAVLVQHFIELVTTSADRTDLARTAEQRAVHEAVRRYPSRKRCAMLPWITLQAALGARAEATFPSVAR